MSLWNRSVEICQNEDVTLVWGYATQAANGQLNECVPINFSGATAYFTIYQEQNINSTQLLQLTSGSGAITFGSATVGVSPVSTINITFTNAETLALPQGQWYFDLLVVQSSKNKYYASGTFVVTSSVSRT